MLYECGLVNRNQPTQAQFAVIAFFVIYAGDIRLGVFLPLLHIDRSIKLTGFNQQIDEMLNVFIPDSIIHDENQRI